MKISVFKEPDCTVLVLEGRLDSSGSRSFEQSVNGAEAEWECCILDFEKVTFMSSMGIRVLLKLARAVKSRQERLILAAVPEDIRWILETTGLIPMFTICDRREDALALVNITGERAALLEVQGGRLSHHRLREKAPAMFYWSGGSGPEGEPGAPESLPASLDELSLAVGRGFLLAGGAMDGSRNERCGAGEGEFGCGYFLADGNALLITRNDEDPEAELILTRQPSDLFIGIKSAVSWNGPPNHLIRFSGRSAIRAGDLQGILLQALQQNEVRAGKDSAATLPEEGSAGAGRPALIAGFMVLASSVAAAGDDSADLLLAGWTYDETRPGFEGLENLVMRPDAAAFQGLVLKLKPDWTGRGGSGKDTDWPEMARALREIDGVAEIRPLDPELAIRPRQAWCFVPALLGSGREQRMIIEVAGGQALPPAWELIARRIYAGARKVVLEPLTGGFSPAQPFRATAEDLQGRRMLPTVFKVGPEELVAREQEAHRKYVEKYILNNSTTIMGAHSCQGARGICYNFLGIGGPDSRLDWMGKIYREKDAGDIMALFDRLFTSVLKPWYGQPQWKELHLYRDHVNAFSFFPDLFADAEAVSGVGADQPEIDCPWLGRRLPNPFHFLKEQYPRRQAQGWLWYEGICHGDLNLQNILLDEKENLYVIDFSETGPRNIVADFARLEPILKFETTRLESEADLAELVRFEEGLARAQYLDEKPPLVYGGADAAVGKAYQVILRLRQYARQVVVFENSLIPYLLAVLEWTYPVVSYRSAGTLGKRLALYSAALMVEQIQRIEAGCEEGRRY